MAVNVLTSFTRVINKTVTEILDNGVIDKATDALGTFVTAGVTAIKEVTEEEKTNGNGE